MILFCDFETTGLLKQGSNDWMTQPGIVQIGAIKANEDGDVLGELVQTINPEMKIDEGAAKVHGFTDEKVKGAPTLFEFLPEFADFTIGCGAWGGYNTPFDKGVLWFQLLRYGFETNFPWPPKELDVMKLVSKHLGQVPGKNHDRWKLGNAYEKILGKPLEGAHDALDDIRATVAIWKEIF